MGALKEVLSWTKQDKANALVRWLLEPESIDIIEVLSDLEPEMTLGQIVELMFRDYLCSEDAYNNRKKNLLKTYHPDAHSSCNKEEYNCWNDITNAIITFKYNELGTFTYGSVYFMSEWLRAVTGLGKSFCGCMCRIPDGIEAIADEAFYAYTRIYAGAYGRLKGNPNECCFIPEIVVIPSSVKYIGSLSFRACPIKEVKFDPREEDDVLVISDKAFSTCGYLATFNIPKGFKMAGSGSLKDILSVATETVKVKTMNPISFREMNYLKNVVFQDNAKPEIIIARMFYKCNELVNVSLNEKQGKVMLDSVLRIEDEAFASCTSIEEIELPNVIEIGAYAFAGCISLKKVFLPKVRIIREGAFSQCMELENVCLPEVDILEDGAFESYTMNQNP